MKPWKKHALTALAVVTLPIWFLPAAAILIFGALYMGLYDSLWERGE